MHPTGPYRTLKRQLLRPATMPFPPIIVNLRPRVTTYMPPKYSGARLCILESYGCKCLNDGRCYTFIFSHFFTIFYKLIIEFVESHVGFMWICQFNFLYGNI